MKKSIFIILPLILWAFAACDNDDSEWDSGNLGVNSVEGTWQRVGAYPKVLAIFGSDYTSTIQTFDVDDNLVTDYPQGKYRVAGDSLLVYERGFINRFEFDNEFSGLSISRYIYFRILFRSRSLFQLVVRTCCQKQSECSNIYISFLHSCLSIKITCYSPDISSSRAN